MRARPNVIVLTLGILILNVMAATPMYAAPRQMHFATTSAVAAAGCKPGPRARTVLRVSAAYVSFRDWVYTPWTKGKFKQNVPHRARSIARAVAGVLSFAALANNSLKSLTGCRSSMSIANDLARVQRVLAPLMAVRATTSDSYIGSHILAAHAAFSIIRVDERRL